MKKLTNRIVQKTLKESLDQIDLFQDQLERGAKIKKLSAADVKHTKRKMIELTGAKLALTVFAHKLGFYVGINSGETIVRPYASKKEAEAWLDTMHF